MKKIDSFIFCLFLLLEACAPKDFKFSDDDKALFLKTAQTINNQIISNKVTVLRCPLDSIKTLNKIISGCSYKSIDDSLKHKLHSLLPNRTAKPRIVNDNKYVDPGFLSTQDSLAFLALSRSKWRTEVSVNDFVEYILPYKQELEFVDNWRDSLFSSYKILVSKQPVVNDLDILYSFFRDSVFWSLSRSSKVESQYPSQDNFTWLSYIKEGDCISRSMLMIYYLRASGAPATFDYIPAWGNRPYSKHAYVGLANRSFQIAKLLANENDTLNLVDNLNAAMQSKNRPNFLKDQIPPQFTIQYEKTIPKVYRRTWSTQPNIMQIINKVPQDQLYRKLISPNMLDVTQEYLRTADIDIWVNLFRGIKIAYLAVFDIHGWRPVSFAPLNCIGNAQFRKLGKNILYLPMICNKQVLIPVDTPFILDSLGRKRKLECNFNKKINMKLFRKYPLFSYSAAHVKHLKDCSIWGSNDKNFKEKEQLAVIDKYPFFVEKFEIKTRKKYQYLKVKSNKNKKVRLAHLAYFSDSCGNKVQLLDARLLNGELDEKQSKLYDNSFDSYMVDTAIITDFGFPTRITEVQLCPRNDTNYIIPGNQYELLFWDGEWRSAGRQKATDYFLEYTGVPSETVYWLKCLNEGKEERIFTYENGKQIWW